MENAACDLSPFPCVGSVVKQSQRPRAGETEAQAWLETALLREWDGMGGAVSVPLRAAPAVV